MKNYFSENTTILIVDPFNDFLSEGGKLWSSTKETVKGVNGSNNSLTDRPEKYIIYSKILWYQGCIRSASSDRKRGLCRLEIPGTYTPGL
jgi:hypothetical protein